MNPPTESPQKKDEVIVTFLNLLLANEYVLYTKTRTAHWNIDDDNQFELNVFLENQYNSIDIMIDDIAELIRSLGYFALGSLKDFLSITQTNYNFNKSNQIFETLRTDHDSIIDMIHREIISISNQLNDSKTATLLNGLLEQHRYMVRQLRFFSVNSEYSLNQQILTNSSLQMDWQD
ncbi:MAG: DNA starvation/stationary phase protection protein [Bacteroidales bacterium]|jgi:starvation-inducible DNA-binding protein